MAKNVIKFPMVPSTMIGGLAMTCISRAISTLLSVSSGNDSMGSVKFVQFLCACSKSVFQYDGRSTRVRFTSMVCN